MNKNYFANLDYFNLFDRLNMVQKKFSSDLFIKIIKFNNAEEVWKDYISNGNNMIIFFQELSLQNKILFIKYIDYELLESSQKLKCLSDRCIDIYMFTKEFKDKNSNEQLTKIDIVSYYDILFNQVNEERIIIDNNLNFKASTDEKDTKINTFLLLTTINDWINHFEEELRDGFPEIVQRILDIKNNSVDLFSEKEITKEQINHFFGQHGSAGISLGKETTKAIMDFYDSQNWKDSFIKESGQMVDEVDEVTVERMMSESEMFPGTNTQLENIRIDKKYDKDQSDKEIIDIAFASMNEKENETYSKLNYERMMAEEEMDNMTIDTSYTKFKENLNKNIKEDQKIKR